MSAAETYDYGAQQAIDRFAKSVDTAAFAADRLRDQLAQLGGSLPEQARLLVAVRDAQTVLGILAREIEQDVAESVKACGEREPEVPGVGVLRLNRRKRTEWDSTRLFATTLRLAADRVVDHSIDPDGNQQAHQPTVREFEQAALDILGACLPLTKSLGWRSTGLKECGIDPDSFRATEAGSYSVRIMEAG